jgi:hypothetical protein
MMASNWFEFRQMRISMYTLLFSCFHCKKTKKNIMNKNNISPFWPPCSQNLKFPELFVRYQFTQLSSTYKNMNWIWLRTGHVILTVSCAQKIITHYLRTKYPKGLARVMRRLWGVNFVSYYSMFVETPLKTNYNWLKFNFVMVKTHWIMHTKMEQIKWYKTISQIIREPKK